MPVGEWDGVGVDDGRSGRRRLAVRLRHEGYGDLFHLTGGRRQIRRRTRPVVPFRRVGNMRRRARQTVVLCGLGVLWAKDGYKKEV